LPIAGDSLSSYSKVEAGYSLWITYCSGIFLYRVCAPCMSRAHLLQATVKFQNYK